jgi:hypothetical protein
MRERLVALVAVANRIRGVDRDLPLQPGHPAEGILDLACRDRDDHDVGIRGVAAVPPERPDAVAARPPAIGESAADVSLADE